MNRLKTAEQRLCTASRAKVAIPASTSSSVLPSPIKQRKVNETPAETSLVKGCEHKLAS